MAEQPVFVKRSTVLCPSIKHMTDSYGAAKNATSAVGTAAQDAAKEHAQEEFTFIMDDELITSCWSAISVQSKVKSCL